MIPLCTQYVPAWHDDDAGGACGAAAALEALTTSGLWEPRCERHGTYYRGADRARPLPELS